MADERERELERRFRQSGSVDDEAAWLKERLRAGRLPEEPLRLAALVGHRAACLALDQEPALELEALAQGLVEHGRAVVLRAQLALARAALPEWESRFPRDDRPRIALEAAANQARCPCARHAEALAEQPLRANDAWAAARQVHALRPAQAALLVAAAATTARGGEAVLDTGGIRAALLAAGDLWSAQQVRATVRAELAPWALGSA